MSRRRPPSLDLETLPRDVRKVVEAAVLGEEVEVRRGERELGVMVYRPHVLEGVVVTPPRQRQAPDPAREGVTVVAAVVPLTPEARGRLAEAFGNDYVVLDAKDAPDTADVVLTHPVSPQLMGLLRARYAQARILVTEVEDDELGIHRGGLVSRLLDAGASAYLPPRPVAEVASSVRTFLEGAPAPELTPADRDDRRRPRELD